MTVVAIDGPAGAGKSTVAKRLADRLGYQYVNSGNLYRAITLAVLRSGVDPSDDRMVLETACAADLEFRGGVLYLNGEEVGAALHTDAVDDWVAKHSRLPAVRREVNKKLRRAAASHDCVVEGRDIGTVVFPGAEAKFYLDASVEARARRRYEERGGALSLDEIARRIVERDRVDREKEQGSLRRAEDAVYLDTSDLTINEVCETVEAKIKELA
jgi:cytidylate kinase